MILKPKNIKSVTASTFFPFYLPWSDGTGCHDLCFFIFLFWMLSFKLDFSLCSFPLLKRLFSSPSLSAIDFPDCSAGKESSCSAGDPISIPGSGRSAGKEIGYPLWYSWASLVAQLVKNLPAMWETWVCTLWRCKESDMTGKIPWRGNGYPLQYSGRVNSMDYIVHRVAKSWTRLSDFHSTSFHFTFCR